MNTRFNFLFCVVLSVLLAGCTTFEIGIETATTDQLATATETVEVTTTLTPQASVTATETVAPTPQPQPTLTFPFEGLVYRLNDKLFQIGPNGEATTIGPGVDPQMLPGQFTPRATVSSDGKQMLSWWDWSDLWLVDLTNGQSRNLTNTPASDECCAQFWPGHPDTVIFLTRASETDGLSYKMAAINLDGSGYHILDDANALIGLPALSPDGSTIAYQSTDPRLYHWGSNSEVFNPADYGLTTSGLSGPAWSPDGRSLAWMRQGDGQGSVVIFDLPGKTYRSLHPHQPVGGEGGLLPPLWSPDGNWLAIFDQSQETTGVWVMHPDGSGAIRAYQPGTTRSVAGLQAFWSPDTQRLLIADPNAAGGMHLSVLNLPSGQSEASPLPDGAIPLAWVR